MQLAFFISLFFTIIFTPLIRNLSSYFGLLEKPDARRRHSQPTARLGGIAIFTSCLLCLFLLEIFSNKLLVNQISFGENKYIQLFILGLVSYFLIGLFDDLYRLSPWPRLIGQGVIASIIWFLGFRVETYDFFISGDLNNFASFFITIFWIMGVTNAINWLDGLDGLASGVSSISFVGIAIIALSNNNIEVSILAAILAGSCVGFLNLNCYPAKIFMGDSGSFLIGFSLATLSIMGCSNFENHVDFFPVFLILLIPILDMSIVIFGRIMKKKSPFFPDRSHLHYKLLDLGLSQNQVFSLYFATTLTLIFTYIYISKINYSYNLIIITFTLNLFFLIKRNSKLMPNSKD